MKKKLLICGATGFIGRNMAEYFAENSNYDVYGTYYESPPLDHKGITMIYADLTKTSDVERVMEGVDIIIQAAATTSGAMDIVTKPYHHVTDNAVMNSLIFRAAFEHKVSHVIFFSCTVMYPSSATALKENDFDANAEIYPSYFGVGWTKVYIEKLCEFYSRIGQTKYTAIRHSNIYGPYDKYDLDKSHVFGATMTKVLTAKDRKIIVWGTGEEERDLLYVSDLVDFVDKAFTVQKTDFAVYNAGIGQSISVADLVKKMIEISGNKIDIEYDTTKPSIKTKLFLDISKAKQELGWQPMTSLDEGIKKTMAWYKSNIL
jgi:nucleoside-diphosphate-sugar epimerase